MGPFHRVRQFLFAGVRGKADKLRFLLYYSFLSYFYSYYSFMGHMSKMKRFVSNRPEDKVFEYILGDTALQQSSLAHHAGDNIVEFLVTAKKQPNYLQYCNNITEATEPASTINKYTDHTTEYFSHINLSLAADSPVLATHAPYIQDLRSSILSQPLLDSDILYRGVDLSHREMAEMETLKNFFIPSFTSTSIDRDKAYSKPTLLVIKTSLCSKYACSITPQLSKFYNTEREVLLACYSAFTLERVEKVNNTSVLTLWLDEFYSSLDRLAYTN
jgi:hypothetical protein